MENYRMVLRTTIFSEKSVVSYLILDPWEELYVLFC